MDAKIVYSLKCSNCKGFYSSINRDDKCPMCGKGIDSCDFILGKTVYFDEKTKYIPLVNAYIKNGQVELMPL